MTGLFSVLSTGLGGLKAASFGTSVASENASNVGTDGYTRRVADIQPLAPDVIGGAFSAKSVRMADSFIERRLVSAKSLQGQAKANSQTLAVLDSVLGDEAGNLYSALDKFEAAISDLASSPDEAAVRNTVLASADQLATAFRQAASDLTAARVDTNGRISDAVTQINTRIEQIAQLNADIVKSSVAGRDANTLIDQRDKLVREVASYAPVTVLPGPNQTVNVMLAGSKSLVSAEGTVNRLTATADPTSGEVRIYTTTAGATEDISPLFTSGSIGGYIAARDGALNEAQTGLDQLATDFINAYNTVHASGVGLDGGTGRNLFEPATALGAAANFRVSADVANRPDWIAAAQESSALTGDNRIALALEALKESKFALSGRATAQDGLLSLAAAGGSAVQRADADLEHANTVTDQLVNLRESTSGVSTDEEMIALSRYQRAYQASVRVVDIANSLLDELLVMGR